MFSDNAIKVLQSRYYQPGESSPEDVFNRVAETLAAVDEDPASARDDFYNLMVSRRFLPNSPTLSGAGTDLGQLSACFVLPVEDSLDQIYDTIKKAVLIHKSGGGTGFAFTRLRGKGSKVRSTNGVAGGPVNFMKVFDAATSSVSQGSIRHGANMGILDVHHPDILDFIAMKNDGQTLKNFNISVGVTSDWMKKATATGTPESEIFRKIVESAHKTGDPGLIFLDRINSGRSNPVPVLGPIEATNPCGEQPLYPYDSCNLGSINLSEFVKMPYHGDILWDQLEETVRIAVRFLDNVITANKYPLPEIEEVSSGIRRIGLGVMGWADMLMKMCIPYDSEEAVSLAEKVMGFVSNIADEESHCLTKFRGAFPLFPHSIYAAKDRPYRNSTRTTIAPTGTISIIAGCSGGIEPIYALVMKRAHNLDRDNPDTQITMYETSPIFQEWLDRQPELTQREVMTALTAGKRPNVLPPWFVEAHQVSPSWHLRHQAAFQRHTDNAVSKTINLPNSATVQDVADVYADAWRLNCKGITVYRDGSHTQQVLSTVLPESTVPVVELKLTPPWVTTSVQNTKPNLVREKLGRTTKAIRHKIAIGGHEGYFIVGMYEDGRPGEIFLKMDSEGSMASGLGDGMAKAVSVALQAGVPVETFIRLNKGVRFEPSGFTGNPDIPSCTSILDYIARWLETTFLTEKQSPTITGDSCPDCHASLVYTEGCSKCLLCGYSNC